MLGVMLSRRRILKLLAAAPALPLLARTPHEPDDELFDSDHYLWSGECATGHMAVLVDNLNGTWTFSCGCSGDKTVKAPNV